MHILRVLVKNILSLPQMRRRYILIVIDSLVFIFSISFAFFLSTSNSIESLFYDEYIWLIPSFLFIGIPLYAFTGQYQGITRYVGSSAIYRLALRNFILCILIAVFGFFSTASFLPQKTWILTWVLLTVLIGLIKFALRDLLIRIGGSSLNKIRKVAIFGTGSEAAQLFAALRISDKYRVIAFFGEDNQLWRRSLYGIPIYPPSKLLQLSTQLDQVLLADRSLSKARRKDLLNELQELRLAVLEVPSIDEIASGAARIDSLKPIAIEDLLGRNSIDPILNLLGPGINNSVIFITGAGGSIGSELCRQILKLNPTKMIILDNSESSLYFIDKELRSQNDNQSIIKTVLGSACDKYLISQIFINEGVNVVFHAAAYKHVPIVELNAIQGIYNNVISTKVLCEAAYLANIKKLILISTDKAVRPTNVMGASKRLAELIVQAFSQKVISEEISAESKTIFGMVRFGNVLDSSGSVVPLFREQIAAGGPITLTDPKVVRYFMTIPEAAQLVLQATVLAEGGDVFLLDMGKQMFIKELAEQMIRLSGLTLKNTLNPDGDIEIIVTGLRPGEKLYEELLIDAQSKATEHPLIFRGVEKSIPYDYLICEINKLEDYLRKRDKLKVIETLSSLIPEWDKSKSYL